MSVLGAVPTGTTPLATNIEIYKTGGSGVSLAAIIFHDDRTGAGSDDGRIMTAHRVAALDNVYTDLGTDDQTSPVDHTGEWTTDSVTESEWEVACVSVQAGAWDNQHATVGTYTTLDTVDMLWSMVRAGGKGRVPGTNEVESTFRVREVSDTNNYTEFTVKCTAVQT